jgi:tellurite resistance protein TerC
MSALPWLLFAGVLTGLLLLDLGVFHRRPHVISTKEALGWTLFWVSLALFFNACVYLLYDHQWLGLGVEVGRPMAGREAALKFLAAYLVEKSLSLDNIFVIALIFSYFGVPAILQHRVLFWGVAGALVMRGVMIAAGIALIERFQWLVYLFGALLIVTAVKMLVVRHDNLEPGRNPVVRILRRWLPVTDEYHDDRLLVQTAGRWHATPLLLALVMVETADLLFAVDSIPAVLAITLDPFLVFTSNAFAILGLRSLYFALAAVMGRLRYLKISLVFILAFVGVKMILSHHYPVPVPLSLAIIAGILTVGVVASWMAGAQDPASLVSPLEAELEELARLSYQKARRLAILMIGSTLLVGGAALLLLPGPGLLVIAIGLAILATEFVWARRWLKRLRDNLGEVSNEARKFFRFSRRS